MAASSIQITMEILRALQREHEQLLKQNGIMESAAAYNARMLCKAYFKDVTSCIPIVG